MTYEIYTIVNEDGSDFEPSSGQQIYYSLQEAQKARLRATQSIVRMRAEAVFEGCNCCGDWRRYA
jgi:hypothetical protein